MVVLNGGKIGSRETRGGMHETGPKDLRPWTGPKCSDLELGPMHETFCAKIRTWTSPK